VRGTNPLKPTDHALFFLKSAEGATYAFSDPIWRRFPLEAIKFDPISKPGTEQLQLDVASHLSLASTTTGSSEAIEVLQGFDQLSKESYTALRMRISDPDRDTSFKALGVLLKTGDPGDLRAFLDRVFVLDPNATPPAQRNMLFAFGLAIRKFTNPEALPYLDELLIKPSFRSLRYSALEAVRGIKHPKSVPVLISLLDDSDLLFRCTVVVALAEITGKREMQIGIGQFESDPNRYVNIWKTWWRNEGEATYGRLQ
jgi:hypothetical protein